MPRRNSTKRRFTVPVNSWWMWGQPRTAVTVKGLLLGQREAHVVVSFGISRAELASDRHKEAKELHTTVTL